MFYWLPKFQSILPFEWQTDKLINWLANSLSDWKIHQCIQYRKTERQTN